MGSKRIILAVCAVIVTLVAFLLGCVSLSLPNWWTVTDGNGNTENLGLFRGCVTINSIEDCDYYMFEVTPIVNAARWLFAVGLGLMALTVILGLVLLCTRNAGVALSAMIFDICGAVCCLVCMCIFAYMTHHNKTRGRYGTAFILGIVCLILAVFAGIMFGFAKPRKSDREGIVVVAPM